MDVISVDIAIVGAGTAGLNARREAERANKSWVLIEAGPYGTTCARVGCMPSKLLIAAAEAAHHVRGAGRFGVQAEGLRVDGEAVMERVRRERDRFAGFVVESTEALPEERRLHGRARFVGPTTLEVDDHTRVEASAVVLATGSAPWVPPPFDQLPRGKVIVNDDVFEWEDLPRSVAVVGTGIIGLELGQALHRLGVETTFFNPFEVLGPFTDPEVSRVAREVLDEELDLQIGIADVNVEDVEGGVCVRWTTKDGQTREANFEVVLAAAGRRPTLPDLGPTGLEVDARGRPLAWDACSTQLGDLPVFLAGDASGHRPLLHEASDEGRIAGANAVAYPEVSRHVRRTPLAIAFTDPQMALAGLRYDEIGDDGVVAEVSFDDQGRSRVMGMNRGLLRVYGDRRTCRLVGAEIFGPRAEHLAHLLAWAVQRGETVFQLLEMPFYHPVIEEGLRTALRNLARELRVIGMCRSEDLADAPGD